MVSLQYHDRTKHHFDRFARSLGFLDWANQPDPFRRFDGARVVPLARRPVAAEAPYDALFDRSLPPAAITDDSVAEFLRCSMGLSAWKAFGRSRWALRVNPSSGNLHPTETYLVRGGRVWHYAPREHALEERCVFDHDDGEGFLVALSSIYWREAWKYGERAFRYCQHDAGHAIGALRFAAALLGWRCTLLTHWSGDQVAALLGLDRDADFADVEREEPECIALVAPTDAVRRLNADPLPLVEAAVRGKWYGRANRLSASTVSWPIIDAVSRGTRWTAPSLPPERGECVARAGESGATYTGGSGSVLARSILLRRRSALAFDRESALSHRAFTAMLRRLQPAGVPWDAIDWPPHVHLVFFVHRVEGLEPGIYAYPRAEGVRDLWAAAMRPEFLWEPAGDGLFLLVPIDCRDTARRLSCDQEIAADGFWGMAMIARLEGSLRERGDAFYRRLFWECGLLGQLLYLEAEAVGARATGIGCFYDDPVHELLGLEGHHWQSLYHFSMGMPVEDSRLTSEPGYEWEATQA